MRREEKFFVRCPNCLKRIPIKEARISTTTCPHCNIEYRICWPSQDQPMIRGLLTPPEKIK